MSEVSRSPRDTRRAGVGRLGGPSGDRRQLAIVMARDILCAVVNAGSVQGVLVVCDNADDVESFQLPGDLPYLKSSELDVALSSVATWTTRTTSGSR